WTFAMMMTRRRSRPSWRHSAVPASGPRWPKPTCSPGCTIGGNTPSCASPTNWRATGASAAAPEDGEVPVQIERIGFTTNGDIAGAVERVGLVMAVDQHGRMRRQAMVHQVSGEAVTVVLAHAGGADALEELVQQRFVFDHVLRAGGIDQQPGHV